MAQRNATERVLTSKEQRLIRYYLREGGTEDRLPKAARVARVSDVEARQMLKRVHVQAEIARRRGYLEFEQARLDAQDIHRKEEAEERQIQVAESKLFIEFNKLVETPPDKMTDGHKMKADILKLGLIITGTIRDGRTERVIQAPLSTVDDPATNPSQVYQSIFERGRAAVRMLQEEQAADLYPADSPLAPPAPPERYEPSAPSEPDTPAPNEAAIEIPVKPRGRR